MAARNPVSFHVPGHKHGELFPESARKSFAQILPLDMTEIPGLDDLHAPKEVIAEAEMLAADFFQSDHTFFLVGGSTAGNIAMLLASCSAGDQVIVQRNSHKSVMNGLELCAADPIYIAPEYNQELGRYTAPSYASLKKALELYPSVKAVMLTYPDYFGDTYDIGEMIELVHTYDIPVLVDEAHGVHFSLGDPFPPSSLELGADIVVQSAHKMAPAMTMTAFLHINSRFISKERVAYFLQMIQSSSPSYPLMASLDISRAFLATLSPRDVDAVMESVRSVREILNATDQLEVLPYIRTHDPLKITLHVKHLYHVKDVTRILEGENIFPELVTHNQILFIHALHPFTQVYRLRHAMKKVQEQLKFTHNSATMDIKDIFMQPIQQLALSYQEMSQLPYKRVPLDEGVGHIAAEAIIPYPPGIPLVLKGERITKAHILAMEQLQKQGVGIQQRDEGLQVYRF